MSYLIATRSSTCVCAASVDSALVSTVADNEVLAPVALDRARALAPLVTLAIGWYLSAGDLVGLPLTAAAFAIDVVLLGILVVLTIAMWRRRIPDRAGHVVLGVVWWLPVIATVQSFAVSAPDAQALFVVLELLGLAVILHTRFVVWSLAVLDLCYVPFLIYAAPPDWQGHLTGTIGAQILAVVFHRVFRAAMLVAEVRRRAQADAAAALVNKLEEIERSRAQREALAAQVAATERIEATGTLAASFAHQMNNILTGITMTASLAARRGGQAHRADYDVILNESQRGSDLTRALLAFSRRSPLERDAHVFDDVVRARCDLVARMLPRTVQLDLQLAAAVSVSCDVVQIGQLLMNLAMNAVDTMDGKGTVIFETTVVAYEDDRFVQLRVRDHGRGMDDATRARVFDPFFTTKAGGKGMGLPTAWGIVRGHGGTIQVDSIVGTGTTVTVQLPVLERSMS